MIENGHKHTAKRCNWLALTGKGQYEHVLAGRREERPTDGRTLETAATWSAERRQTAQTRRV